MSMRLYACAIDLLIGISVTPEPRDKSKLAWLLQCASRPSPSCGEKRTGSLKCPFEVRRKISFDTYYCTTFLVGWLFARVFVRMLLRKVEDFHYSPFVMGQQVPAGVRSPSRMRGEVGNPPTSLSAVPRSYRDEGRLYLSRDEGNPVLMKGRRTSNFSKVLLIPTFDRIITASCFHSIALSRVHAFYQ